MYLDSSATTPLDEKVKNTMIESMDIWGNENSQHFQGKKSKKIFDQEIAKIAKILKVNSAQLAITYSGTDSNRRVLWEGIKMFGRENIYASAVEHSSIYDEISQENLFDPFDVNSLNGNPKMIALTGANSETGAIYDLGKWRKKFPEALILQDVCQSFAKGILPDFDNADFISFSPQKIYGPKMIGLLYIKNPLSFPALAKDTHTKNIFLLAGMSKTFEIFSQENSKNMVKIKKWQEQIENHILSNTKNVIINDKEKERLIGLISISWKNLRGAELMMKLSEEEGIAVSTGSACNSDIFAPTKVIQFVQSDTDFQYPIRIGLHKYLNDEDVTDFCEILTHYVSEMQNK
jgi:cysteine desulfurase